MDRVFLLVLGSLIISGCASNIPKEITLPLENSLQVEQVVAGGAGGIGQTVRWGGVIASVKNKKDQTWIEIVAKDLKTNGRPAKSDESPGRFVAIVNQFLEPQIYSKGRQVTVVGQLAKKEAGKIDEQPYNFPVVMVSKTWLWQELKTPPRYHPSSFYGPYYGPYYDPFWDLRFRSRFFFGHDRRHGYMYY